MYSIAIRKRQHSNDHFWNHDDFKFVECSIDTIGGRYWYADPFVFEKDGITYIFFEMFDLIEYKGKEGYCIYNSDGSCTLPQIIIEEDFHLSFPNLFEEEGVVYMMPEMSGSHSLRLYKAVSFPNKWEAVCDILPDVYACDSVFINDKGSRWLLTNEMFHNVPNGQYASCYVKNYMYEMDGLKVIDHGTWVGEGDYGLRNAGKSFSYNGKIYRIGQDNRDKLYGNGMVLFEIESLKPYKEKYVNSWSHLMLDKHIIRGNSFNLTGTHTYNFSDNYEVIDFSMHKPLKTNIWIKKKIHSFRRKIT